MSRTKIKQSSSNFFADVYDVVRLVPKGRVTTYGAIGQYLGMKSSARMVGWPMYGCPRDVFVYCVVNSAGLLTGKHHFKPPRAMQQRLEKEGIRVVKDKVQNFKVHFWNPSEELL